VGLFSVAPDGRWIAISRPTGIDLLTADGGQRQTDLVAFPFIYTYSEYAFKPPVVWSPESAFFSVVVPSYDPLAEDAHATLYRVHTDGTVNLLGRVSGNFVFGGEPLPAFAPDGRRLVYGQAMAGSAPTLHLVTVENNDDRIADTLSEPYLLGGLGWSPGSRYYLYVRRQFIAEGLEDEICLLAAAGAVQTVVPRVAGPVSARWLDDESFIVLGGIEGLWGFYYFSVGGGTAFVDHCRRRCYVRCASAVRN